MELHHRVGAVEVAGKARDKGLAGHLGGIIIDGRAAAKAGGRRIPHPANVGAGDINAAAGQLKALGIQLVDGGHPQRVAQTCTVLHLEPDGIGHPQHGVCCRDVAAFQRGADAGGRHRLFLKLRHGHHDHLHTQRSAEGAQQLRVAGRFGTKGKVFAADQRTGIAVPHDAQHELLRGQALDLLKVRREVILHAKACHQCVFICCGQQPFALHLVHHRQPEGEQCRSCIVDSGPLHCLVDHCPVADVDTVKKAHCHCGAFFRLRQRQRCKL